MSLGSMSIYGSPKDGCDCYDCEKARAERAKVKPVLKYDPYPFSSPLRGSFFEWANSPTTWPRVPLSKTFDGSMFSGPKPPLPFEPQAAVAADLKPEYTHVLLDFDSDGDPDGFELHTAESVLEAIADRNENPAPYAVFRISDAILSVKGV